MRTSPKFLNGLRRLRPSIALISMFASLLLTSGPASPYDWANPGMGPWRAQIVDRETRQPLEGAVVVAVWEKRYGSVGGWAGGGYFASEEVVTGADGQFTIAPLKKRLLEPFAILQGPEFYIFKAGYGRWAFQGQEEWPKLDLEEQEHRLDKAFWHFNSDGVVIELLALKTRAARLHFISSVPAPMPNIPSEAVRKYREAIDHERVTLGLDPPKPAPR